MRTKPYYHILDDWGLPIETVIVFTLFSLILVCVLLTPIYNLIQQQNKEILNKINFLQSSFPFWAETTREKWLTFSFFTLLSCIYIIVFLYRFFLNFSSFPIMELIIYNLFQILPLEKSVYLILIIAQILCIFFFQGLLICHIFFKSKKIFFIFFNMCPLLLFLLNFLLISL